MKTKIQNLICKSLQNLSDELENDALKNPDASTKIYGGGGNLDSLALVSFISDLEESISDTLGIDITLADERAMSRRNSPFKDVQSLNEYILELISQKSPSL
ncbi:hypothetical protein BKH41_04305 [Helicobacter sp. 12S02232-10]|uniref:hypothetical protein n=1 Tax=Helicobacter sp. 12S02232-10 TaxID=1476197 RepID=UPI000BA4EA0A|nr:hypothetical protein [Helicobacter sp. 12S02232-10]PAF48857.1 hypothetical protein BKH41_04305 [Helicobacter sp. 12S02232-10]